MKKILFFYFILWYNCSFATRYYVNINATGNNNGLSWINAYVNLQSAISGAIAGDEIWVATGIYKASTSNRSSSFVLKNGVNLYGSFSGTETTVSERIINDNPTTLSGDIGGIGDNTDNTKIIVKIQNITSPIIFDGFRIVSGYDSSSFAEGAGMNIANNAGGNITVNNCMLYNNYAYRTGGAALVDVSNVTFNDTQFLYNSSYDYGGGAIYSGNVSSSNIYLNRCKFIGNSSRSGAVIVFDGDNLVFDRCIIANNTTTSLSMISIGTSSNFKILSSLIVGNLLTSNSGSAIIECGASSGTTSRDIINSTIAHNRNSSTFTIVYPPIKYLNLPLRIYNSIIYDNTTSGTSQISSGCSVQNCILSGSYSTALNSYFVNPNFVSPATLISAPFDATNYDYSLLNISQGINTGNNSLLNAMNYDLSGNNRIYGANVDIGAYEFSSPLSINNSVKEINLFYDYTTDEIVLRDNEFIGNKLFIYDISGRFIKKINLEFQRTKLDMNINGVYIVKVKDSTIKIVLMH